MTDDFTDNVDLDGFSKVHQALTTQGLVGHEQHQQILAIHATLWNLANQLQQLPVPTSSSQQRETLHVSQSPDQQA